MPDLVRVWNGQAIKMRNDRICLTDLCRAGETAGGNPIRFAHWFESDATQRFLQVRSAATGREVLSINPVIDNAENSALIIRESERGEAWGDKVVGMKLAARLCPELEHQVFVWFTEELERRSLAEDNQPLVLSPIEAIGTAAKVVSEIHQMIVTHTPALIDARMEIELKRDLLLLKSVAVQSVTGMLPGTSSVLSPLDKLPRFMGVVVDPEIPIGVTEFFLQLNDSNLAKLVTNREAELGKRTKAAYRLRYDKNPEYSNGYLSEKRHSRGFPLLFPTKTGKNVPIACYVAHDWDLIVYSAREMGLLRPDMAAKLLAECQQFRLNEE